MAVSHHATDPDALSAPEARVLVVEDEDVLAGMVVLYLVNAGFRAERCATGERAIDLVTQQNPDLVLMDLSLNGAMDGIEACRRIREISDARVVVMSARANEHDLRVALMAGAEDYVTKPFSARELVWRLRTMLDQSSLERPAAPHCVVGDLVLDSSGPSVTLSGVPVPLTRTERDLLNALASDPGREFGADELGTLIWGPQWGGDLESLAALVDQVRRLLGGNVHDARYIVTPTPNVYRMGTGQ